MVLRIDPARAIIRSIPLAESGFRYGDVLLHDGAPTGERTIHGQIVSVFDAIELLDRSSHRNFEVELRVPDSTVWRALLRQAADRDIGIEDWKTIRCLCSACSRGLPADSGETDDLLPQGGWSEHNASYGRIARS